MKKLFIVLIISVCSTSVIAQMGINSDGSKPDPSAQLDIKSTTKGFLMPRVTIAQMSAIVNPTDGLRVLITDDYNGISPTIWYYSLGDNNWAKMNQVSIKNSFFWAFSDPTGFNKDIYNLNVGKVGIGTNTPAHKLTVKTGTSNIGWAHTNGFVAMGSYVTTIALTGALGYLGTHTNHRFGFFTNGGGDKMTLAVNRKVGINTINPLADLHIKQRSEAFPVVGAGLQLLPISNVGGWNIGTDVSNDLDFAWNGLARSYIRSSDGVFLPPSDFRLKKDIQPVGEVLSTLMKLEAKTYHYKDNQDDDPLSYGFIAQEVEKLFPDFVSTNASNGMKGVAYQNVGVVLIKAIQERQQIIETLTKRVEQLEKNK